MHIHTTRPVGSEDEWGGGPIGSERSLAVLDNITSARARMITYALGDHYRKKYTF